MEDCKMKEYIKKEDAIAVIQFYWHEEYETVAAYLLDIPPANVKQIKFGRWTDHYRSGQKVKDGFVSTCCDMWNERMAKFCPNCGAEMVKNMK